MGGIMTETLIIGILELEFDSEKEAVRSAEKFSDCPHVLFWATTGSNAHIVLAVPERKKLWAEYITEHPEQTFGGKKTNLIFPDQIHQPSELKMRIPSARGDRAPCGSYCPTCPSYKQCSGCPATIHYDG